VDAESVGLFGHSEGGWVVLRAAGLADPAFVVTNSGPGLSVGQQDRWAMSANLRATGVSEDGIAESEATYDQVLKWIGEGVSFTEIEGTLNADPGYQHMVDFGSPLNEETWEFVRLVHMHDPFEDLVRLRCPHLALFGGTDLQIPVALTASAFAAAACERSGSAGLTIETFPGVGHRFQAGEEFVPGYFTTLTRWLSAAVDSDYLTERRAV
jgi:pimeloyl-ACP methyl ester carboxylesterase